MTICTYQQQSRLAVGRAVEPAGSASEHQASSAGQPDLTQYMRVLLARFAVHGQAGVPGHCRCGDTRPCVEEHHVARLLELAGDACR
jgi:hypothetical protein